MMKGKRLRSPPNCSSRLSVLGRQEIVCRASGAPPSQSAPSADHHAAIDGDAGRRWRAAWWQGTRGGRREGKRERETSCGRGTKRDADALLLFSSLIYHATPCLCHRRMEKHRTYRHVVLQYCWSRERIQQEKLAYDTHKPAIHWLIAIGSRRMSSETM